MKKNNNLLILATLGFLAVLLVGFSISHKKSGSTPSQMAQKHQLMDVASGDTNNEVLKTILANQQKLESENKKLSQANKNLRVKQDQAVKNAVAAATDQLKTDIQSTKTYLQKQISGVKPASSHEASQAEYDVGDSSHGDMITVVSDMSQPEEPVSHRHQGDLSHRDDKLPSMSSKNLKKKSSVTPYYTLPANSTINHVYLMSAIIAEVPVSNKLLEPAFPFKAIIGKDDLIAANGAHLPEEIAGAVISGYSVGNMTMSCSRSYVMQILFVFQDGNSFTVFPEQVKSSATSLYPNDALGYLSDPYGATCVTGQYLTNAPRVLSTYAALGGLSATGQALSQAQLSTLSNSFETTQNLTGNVSKYAAGSFLSGASQKSLEWYSKRVDGTFDAVYIPASRKDAHGVDQVTTLTLNLTRNVLIDLDRKARKIVNEHKNDNTITDQLD